MEEAQRATVKGIGICILFGLIGGWVLGSIVPAIIAIVVIVLLVQTFVKIYPK